MSAGLSLAGEIRRKSGWPEGGAARSKKAGR